ncbi:uncharacterized protein PGRI_013770 [Penicillium griseofulvum]|uniref:Uncharacterized protein n=1 Tax=Penicillium patulum TaxID=5078 RepID=A0A135LEW5_PENPA|nr:uncharacterized protein PGRI_013770 [Penicillium griseofulvum]KXG47507.1 hypothetical protein PGRI_013770 [Penicillium griseofulvum]
MSLLTTHFGSNHCIGGGLLSNNPTTRCQQLSKIRDYAKYGRSSPKKARTLRKATYKQKLERTASHAIDANPKQLGGPRAFRVLLAGKDAVANRKIHDPSSFEDEGDFLYFAAFGIPNRPIKFNNTWIQPEKITLSAEKNIYTISTADENGKPVSLYLNFTLLEKPTGYLEVSEGGYALLLQPYAVSFNVQASANCGAYKSTGNQTLAWDETSNQWIFATWDSSMIFSYDTVSISGPFGPNQVNEVAYTDIQDDDTSFQLTSDLYPTEYSCIMDGTNPDGKVYCLTTVTDASYVPPPPEVRANSDIKSVFPLQSLFKFDTYGMSFTGAYIVPSNQVYGVIGTGNLPTPKSTESIFKSSLEPMPHAFHFPDTPDATSLSVTGLLSLNPMEDDPSSPTGYTDVVSQAANSDFNDIVTFYMDPQIRTTFVQAAPITLSDPTVLAIATDSPDNSSFYTQLQMPYVTASLSRSTLDQAKQCNGLRAEAQLQGIPAESPVYQRHSDALYRHRFLLNFPTLQQYLDDQANTDYTADMLAAAVYMKTQIAQAANGMGDSGDPTTAAQNLKNAQADIDSLCAWATDQKLWWAFNLYYWCTQYYLPNLYAQITNGTLSGTVCRTMKALSGTFGMLEGSAQNPNGKSFQEAFNDVVRVYQMISIIPQFVDVNGNSEEFDSILKAMLEQFHEDNSNSLDPNIMQEAENAEMLAANDALRGEFFQSLKTAMVSNGALGSWAGVVQQWGYLNQMSPWYQKLVGAAGVAATFLRSVCGLLLISSMVLGGGWKQMSPEQKAAWIASAAGVALTFAIKAIQGAIRVTIFWEDIGSYADCLKAFFGFDSTESEFAQWFVRMGPETMQITEDAITVPMKIFGRSAGEFLTNAVGTILAGVNVVLSIIDAVKSNDPVQKSMDSMMIISSGLQILATAAGWLVSAEIVTGEAAVTICDSVAACAGPAAIIFAAIGLVIMIVMMFLHKDPPNPVQDFVDNLPAGLKMEYDTDIDYFNIVPPDSSSTSLNGVSFEHLSLDWGHNPCLQLGSENASIPDQFAIQAASAVTYLPDTCWSICTDYQGNTRVFTYALDAKQNNVTVCLTQASDGSLLAAPPPAMTTVDGSGNTVPVDPTLYAKELATQQWSFTCQSTPTTVNRSINGKDVPYTVSAEFEISQGGQYLYADESYQTGNTTIGLRSIPDTWILTLRPEGPSPFTYVQPNWTLTTQSTDESNYVLFSGPTSLPLEWAVTPALPAFLQLGESTTDGGTISQVSGISPTVMSATTYTVTASITIIEKIYQQTSTFSITVTDQITPPSTPVPKATQGRSITISDGVPGNESTHPPPSTAMGPVAGQAAQRAPAKENSDGIETAYERMMANAPPFFKWYQTPAVPLSQHYTASAAISKMQNSLTGWWRGGNFESLYFTNPSAGPSIQPGDPCDYHDAANAYVAQAISNGDGYAKPYCNWSATQETIDTFNTALWDCNIDRYIEWLQWSGSASVTGGLCTCDQYISSIKSADWLSEKAAEQADGLWPDQSMEMFFHFLKLAALGATEDQISDIYTAITVRTAPSQTVLDPSGFSDITPSTWQSYRSYLESGNIQVSQLNVSNLGESRIWYEDEDPVPVTMTSYADTGFLRDTGYYQAPPSGCCLRSTSQVLMEDGRTLKPIAAVKPGDCVWSVTANSARQAPQVAFISQPTRNRRNLYAYSYMPDVLFTDTHPLYLGIDEHGFTLIGFVDVQKALSVNPLWASFTIESVSRDELIMVSPDQNDETLFDLVFDQSTDCLASPPCSLPTYTVRSNNGQELRVCSEAPDPAMLLPMTAFVLAVAKELGASSDTLGFFPDGLAAGVLDYSARIRRHRSVCANAIVTESDAELNKESLGMSTAVAVLSDSQLSPQVVADSMEALIMSLGLSMQIAADNGWQQISPALNTHTAPHLYSVVSTHFLQLTQPALLTRSAQLPRAYHQVLPLLRKSLLDPSATVDVQVCQADHAPTRRRAQIHRLGPHLFQLRADITMTEQEAQPTDQSYTVTLTIGSDIILTATGSLTPDADARWPVYLTQLNGASQEMLQDVGTWHVGSLMVTSGTVTREHLNIAETWGLVDDRDDGHAVGRDIVASVIGGV